MLDPNHRSAGTADLTTVLQRMLWGRLTTEAIALTAQLRIPDQLIEGPRTVGDLAQRTGVDDRALARLLRAVASMGVLRESAPETYELTDLGQLLRSDIEGSMQPVAANFAGQDYVRLPQSHLAEAVRTGQPSFNDVFGVACWDYYQAHPEVGRLFNQTMREVTIRYSEIVGQVYDFSGFRTIADLGGGNGILLLTVLRAFPTLRGILFDLPSVIDDARRFIEGSDVADRVQLLDGNFLEAVPEGCDAYIISRSLHAWDDQNCLRILQNVATVLPPEGRLLVIESPIPEPSAPGEFDGPLYDMALVDLHLMVNTTGRKRTIPEYRAFFAQANLEIVRLIPVNYDQHYIFECRRHSA